MGWSANLVVFGLRPQAARSAAGGHGGRMWSASEVRGSAPIELRQGSGGAAPGKFLGILLSRVHFYNRVHFFTLALLLLKMLAILSKIELNRD